MNEEIGVAVDERRHGTVTHLGRAISVRDLVDQVKSRCPENTRIPSVEWNCLQFWPNTPAAQSAMQYASKFRMKFMVQQQQWKHSHVDCHYAAAIFRYLQFFLQSVHNYYLYVLHTVRCTLLPASFHYRYMREYALLLRDVCAFVCLDDKHKIKISKLCMYVHL